MKRKNPLVSVIIPVYNASEYLEQAIVSILNQTYTNLELLLIDDCSSDCSLEIIHSIKDERIKVYINEQNRGISYTTNRGLDLCNGKYIALMDDDDISSADRLQLQVDFLEKNKDVDILGGAAVEINEVGETVKFCNIPRYNSGYIKAVLMFNCMDFYNGTTMMRKEFVENNHLRYKENCFGMQDFRFFIESSKVGKITTIGNLILYHRLHAENETSRRKQQYAKERANAYALFQRESLGMSGFHLNNNQLCLINKVLAEGRQPHCESIEELKELYHVFEEVLKQAKAMHIDFYDDLELLCKRKLGLQIERMNMFHIE